MTTTTEVPYPYTVGIEGRGYLIDRESNEWRHVTIPQIRPQADTGDEMGSQTLNPEGLWVRFQESWDYGAGQDFYDKADSNRARFRSSFGVDPWTKGELTLLKTTDQKKTTARWGYLLVVGTYLYLYDYDANKLFFTQDISVDSPTWTEVTGLSATKGFRIATDGYTVYIAQGTNGIYTTTRGAGTASSWVTGTVNYVGYVKGRLMAAADNSLYNVTTSGALPTALLTHTNTDLDWFAFAEGTNSIYIGAFSGDKGRIYRTAVKADGTALDVPVVAGELPDGELLTGLYGYLGFIFIGSTKGVRFATASADGDLTIGALIEIGDESVDKSVFAFEGQGQYVWFSWGNYDESWTGVGRLNLQNFTDAEGLVPAYASDLMVAEQGAITSIVTFKGLTAFVVDTSGVWAEHATDYVPNGVLYSGDITFGLSEQKIPRFLDIRHRLNFLGQVGGTITGWLGNTREVFTEVGSYSSTGSSDTLTVSDAVRSAVADKASALEVQLELEPADTSVAPVATRWTLKSEVQAPVGYYIYAPLLISETDDVGYPETRDLSEEIANLQTLREDRTIVEYQEGNRTYSATIEDYEWRPHKLGTLGYTEGTFLVKMKVAL